MDVRQYADDSGSAPEAWPPLPRLALARGDVDRAAHLRQDQAWLDAAWADPATRVLVVDHGRAIVGFGPDGAGLVFLPPEQAPEGVRFLLGVAADGAVYFGVSGTLAPAAEVIGVEVRPAPLREVGPLLSDRDAGLLTHAVALGNFHDHYHFCPHCGEPSVPASSGHARRCTVEGTDEFPRSDPAMIVLVTDPDDRALLARNAAWPERRVSILAGFVEAGESSEQAVTREVQEEVGIDVGRVRYLGSQPWPMPQSLMLGFRAEGIGDLTIKVDEDEIAEANWYSREELAAALASDTIRLPPPVSIAHQIIQTWYGTDIPGSW